MKVTPWLGCAVFLHGINLIMTLSFGSRVPTPCPCDLSEAVRHRTRPRRPQAKLRSRRRQAALPSHVASLRLRHCQATPPSEAASPIQIALPPIQPRDHLLHVASP